MDFLYSTELKKMYSDSIFSNVFGFWGLKIKWIPESGEVIVSQDLEPTSSQFSLIIQMVRNTQVTPMLQMMRKMYLYICANIP